MPELSYDLHLHSCLSPCGDDDMLPSNIVGMAVVKGLDVIALTDHNTSRNCPAFLELARAYGVLAIPGMELCTSEEVHVVCLFPTLEAAMDFDRYVHRRIPPIPNDPAIFGKQLVVGSSSPTSSFDAASATVRESSWMRTVRSSASAAHASAAGRCFAISRKRG